MALRWTKCVRCVRNSTCSFRIQQCHRTGFIYRQSTSSSSHTGSKGVSRKWNPFTWYNQMLEKYPVRTKCITSGVLYGVGDIIAQKAVSGQNSSIDDRRFYRAIVYGAIILAPLCHVHFNLLEWLVVEKIAFRASLVPFAKMFLDQFGYWAPTITALYHVSMGAMEGLGYNDTMERLKHLFWPTLKAGWMIWPMVMIVNFKMIPIPHQLNFCLVFSLAWASILSVIRAPVAVEQKSTELQFGSETLPETRTVTICAVES